MSQKVVAVFGASGGQGAAVARALAQCPEFKVRGLTVDGDSLQAQQLRQQVSEVVAYDPNDQRSLESALTGAYAAFVTTATDYSDPDCFEREKAQGRLIANACKAAGVGHVVYSSQLHTTRVSGVLVRHMVAKAEIEDYMRDLRLPLTCLLMPLFYEDFCSLFRPMTRDGCQFELFIPTGFTPLDLMSVEDMGPVVGDVLRHRDAFLDKTLSLSGDKLTIWEVATVLSKYLAPKVFKDKQLTVHEFSQLSLPGARDWAQMFNFLVREDQRYKVRDTKQYNPKLQSFKVWVSRNRDSIDRAMA